MFETLFQYPAVVARHRSGPFAEARERFLNHLASQGFAHATLLVYARELLVIAKRIDITMGEAIGLSTIEAAANRRARWQHQRQHVHSLRCDASQPKRHWRDDPALMTFLRSL